MARRNDHSRKELEALALESAIDIVKKEGLQALTARHLAQTIGYTPGTLYNLFGSMDGLFFLINGLTLDRLHKAIANAAFSPAANGLVETLKIMARTYMKFAHENKALWLMVFHPSVLQEEKAPDWYRQKVKDEFVPLEQALSPLFEGRNAHQKALAARVLWSSVHGICLMQITGKIDLISDEDAHTMSDYLIENFIKGLSV